MPKQRKLNAFTFDFLNNMSHAFGGIGGGAYYDYSGPEQLPLCVHGMVRDEEQTFKLRDSLHKAGISVIDNDNAVYAINKRKKRKTNSRVSFEDWCKELNVVPSTRG